MSGGFRSRSKGAQDQTRGSGQTSSRNNAGRSSADSQQGKTRYGNSNRGPAHRENQHRGGQPERTRQRGKSQHPQRDNRARNKHNSHDSIVSHIRGDVDLPRKVALEVLFRVNEEQAYANLLLPKALRQYKVKGRDAAFATEITYGTLRTQGIVDAIIDDCSTRLLATLHPVVRNALRLGVYQLLYTRVEDHAAVHTSVEMVDPKARGFVNAILRKVSRSSREQWLSKLAPSQPLERLAWQNAHPRWIAESFARILPAEELEDALAADSARPLVHLAARPQELGADELSLITGGEEAKYSPYGVYLPAGDPGDLEVIRQGLAIVQDEGSQLIARAVTKIPLAGTSNTPERWLDLCAGPGGKATMLGALAQGVANVDAVEVVAHRANLVEQATRGLPVHVHNVDGRNSGLEPGYDRILIDAPCSGLGALRRRPEARWRKEEADIVALQQLQFELLHAAYGLLRPGGSLVYSTCSPDLRETRDVVTRAIKELGAVEGNAHDLAPELPADAQSEVTGPAIQLWPHRHGTDAMFFAWLQKPLES
ncbi:MAG: transcription antitermination factor NusB [Corynebacterium sp.]|nr:transcription antitermination factor NusB [Corynebacterium sp.]